MNPKSTRWYLAPLALLTIIILAACTPVTATPESNAPAMPAAGQGMGTGPVTPGSDMMGSGQTDEMMASPDAGMPPGTAPQTMAPADVRSLAEHMNATLIPLSNLAGMMGDPNQAREFQSRIQTMQQDLAGMMNNPDSQALAAMMQETGDMMQQFQNMAVAGQFQGDPAAVAQQMEQLMLHMGVMAQMMGGFGNQEFMGQMNGFQQQFQGMMADNAFSPQEFGQMMGGFGGMMGQMGTMFGGYGPGSQGMMPESGAPVSPGSSMGQSSDGMMDEDEEMMGNEDEMMNDDDMMNDNDSMAPGGSDNSGGMMGSGRQNQGGNSSSPGRGNTNHNGGMGMGGG